MADIPLTQGQVAIVDDEDYPCVSQFKWFAYWNSCTRSYYAARTVRQDDGRRYLLGMHRFILGLGRGREICVDHINHDTLDNRRSNLRPSTTAQNCANQRTSANSTTGVRGVRWDQRRRKYEASIRFNKKLVFLGRWDAFEDAVAVRRHAETTYFGAFA